MCLVPFSQNNTKGTFWHAPIDAVEEISHFSYPLGKRRLCFWLHLSASNICSLDFLNVMNGCNEILWRVWSGNRSFEFCVV